MKCRHCKAELTKVFVDLGSAPPSNAYLTVKDLRSPEKWYPLRVMVCDSCWLVQTEDYSGAEELFSEDYAYFSSYSSTWLNHAELYVSEMIKRFKLDPTKLVIEVAANDGYLLRYVKNSGIPCVGIEPTKSTASVARGKGIDVIESFFGVRLAEKLAKEGKQADLMVANNVLAHVPDINDFVAGFSILLKPSGVATFEFPHIMRLVAQNQFDTIYHEHYSYLSLLVVDKIFRSNGLLVFDVENIQTHGGSLRVFACRKDTRHFEPSERLFDLLSLETKTGISTLNYYEKFQEKANKVKNDFLDFLIKANFEGKKVVGYGAAAKGNTLLNYAGVRSDLIKFVVDKNPAKQGRTLPGSRIPITEEGKIREFRPDYVVIFPWNIRDEIMSQLYYVKNWGGHFVTAVPELQII